MARSVKSRKSFKKDVGVPFIVELLFDDGTEKFNLSLPRVMKQSSFEPTFTKKEKRLHNDLKELAKLSVRTLKQDEVTREEYERLDELSDMLKDKELPEKPYLDWIREKVKGESKELTDFITKENLSVIEVFNHTIDCYLDARNGGN